MSVVFSISPFERAVLKELFKPGTSYQVVAATMEDYDAKTGLMVDEGDARIPFNAGHACVSYVSDSVWLSGALPN